MTTEAKVRDILAQIVPDADFETAEGFLEKGLIDSFDVILITGELEMEFGISIDVELILPENYDSVDALVRLVEAVRGGAGSLSDLSF